MSKTESYDDRRKLFKDVWDTSTSQEGNDAANSKSKPKVIKTVRLTEDSDVVGKKKKQRWKKLQSVCNKLLAFCDQQDAEDFLCKQLAAKRNSFFSMRKSKLRIKKGKVKCRRRVLKSKYVGVRTHDCTEKTFNLIDGTTRNYAPNYTRAYSTFLASRKNYKNFRIDDGSHSNKNRSKCRQDKYKYNITVNRNVEPKKMLQITKINIF